MDQFMNPIVIKAMGSLVRAGLMLAVPFFVSRGIWTTDEATATLAAVATALTALGWSIFEKYKSQKKLVTALALPAGVSEKQVEHRVATGPTPPVTLPKDVPPYTPA